jgi:hypothetical protein
MLKKLALLSLTLGVCSISFGQFKYGVKAGLTQSFIKESLASTDQDINLQTGLQVGGFIDLGLLKNLTIRPGLQITQKGFKSVEGQRGGPFYRERNFSITYLELPVNFIYNVQISQATRIFIGAGPVLSAGLFGKGREIFKADDGTGRFHTIDEVYNHPFNKPGYKRIDLGGDFLIGVQVKDYSFSANYNHGLMNILNYNQGIQTTKNRSFAFTVARFIGKP